MKAIVYSLFGFDRARAENCFDFASYLRGLMICLRFNRLLYPGWKTILETDQATYSGFEPLFKYLEDKNIIRIEKNPNGTPLCAAMLWRMKPVFWQTETQEWVFTHVICRDLDSPATYREAQAVEYWISKDKALHAITDSISHDVPLMGGMIGIRPAYFTERAAVQSFSELMKKCPFDLSTKGSDQHFLNGTIYPFFGEKGTDSITQHYCLGHGHTFLSDFHNSIQDIAVPGVSEELKETNSICGHIGASGFYEPPTIRIINKYKYLFSDLIEIEKLYPQIFYWNA